MFFISVPAYEPIAVPVDGLEGELRPRFEAAELLKGHFAVLVAISLAENLGNFSPGMRISFSYHESIIA